MLWHLEGEAHGLVKNLRETPNGPTRTLFEVWSKSADGELGEYMAEYPDRDTAVAKMEMLDMLRETWRLALAPAPQERVIAQGRLDGADAAPRFSPPHQYRQGAS